MNCFQALVYPLVVPPFFSRFDMSPSGTVGSSVARRRSVRIRNAPRFEFVPFRGEGLPVFNPGMGAAAYHAQYPVFPESERCGPWAVGGVAGFLRPGVSLKQAPYGLGRVGLSGNPRGRRGAEERAA